MSRDGDVEAPRSPREWFTVLFGSRELKANVRDVTHFTDGMQRICAEVGLLLKPRPLAQVIFEEESVENVMTRVQRVLHNLQESEDQPHLPLLLVIDDQTLEEIYSDHLVPAFQNNAFIYPKKGYEVSQALLVPGGQIWTGIREDLVELNEVMDEYNPIFMREPEVAVGNYRDRQDEYDNRRYQQQQQPQRQHERNGYYQNEEDRRREEERRYEDAPRESRQPPPPRRPLTVAAVRDALEYVEKEEEMREALAEDMAMNGMDFEHLQLPEHRDDLFDLLHLLLLSVENERRGGNGEEREEGRRLRKRIMEGVLEQRVLEETRKDFLQGLHERVERMEREELNRSYDAIVLLLRAMIQLRIHDILNEAAMELWSNLETPIFKLPARFWEAIGENAINRLCRLAAEVTTNDPQVYRDSVGKMMMEARPQRREGDRERNAVDRRREERENGRGGRVGAVMVAPDDIESDESDTTEVYEDAREELDRGEERVGYGNGYGNGYDISEEYGREEEGERWNGTVNRRDYGREEEEERRREEEEERRMEEIRREEEERRWKEKRDREERDREYQRMLEERAIAAMERRKREEKREEMMETYDRCEGRAPPVSFRKMSNRPVLEDLYRPKAPYIRRALIEGSYTDNEHYLDVQFRLMREDLVAPLREGFIQRKIEAGPNQPLRSSQDFKLYPMIQVGALQVRLMDGLPMRIVELPSHVLCTLREDRQQLKFGNCVVLSSDNFEREFHIGWICDRFQEAPGVPWSGRLAITFFDEADQRKMEETSIDKNATYCIAESPSYLEAYRHVLQVLKKMKRYRAFPLERYLVHMKKNRRLPAYMRWKEGEEDKEEDREREVMYMKMMSKEEERKKERGRKRTTRSSRSATGGDNSQDEDTAPTTTEEGAPSSQNSDDGFNTDEEDLFLTGKTRGAHPNPKNLETLSIRGQSYSVERLEEEFKTDRLDETQRKAMCYALTSELAIIQGPPGTGKTHIGVELVLAILENRVKWRITEPILIVTFSNQALDHFLEKIKSKLDDSADGTPTIVRLGSRSENEVIKLNCLLSTVMKDYEEDLAAPANAERKKQDINLKRNCLKRLLQAVKIVQSSRRNIMAFSMLNPMLTANHVMQLRQLGASMRDSNGNNLNMDETLACWLLDKDYAKRRDLPSSDEDEWGERGGERMEVGGVWREEKTPKEKKKKEKKKGDGRETKKEKNERKRAERRGEWRDGEDSSDEEEEGESEEPMDQQRDDRGEESDDGEDVIMSMLKMVNLRASVQQSAIDKDQKWRQAEKYEVDVDWEAEKEQMRKLGGRGMASDVEIFSNNTKESMAQRGRQRQINVDTNMVRDIGEQKQYILKQEPLTPDEASSIQDVRTLPKERRWRLLVYWQDCLARASRDSLDRFCSDYQRACERAEKSADNCRADVLRKALIIGATTTGSAKRRELIAKIGPKVLIVEEAAEVLEAHLLASIVPSVQHAIFIGDHQQLRPNPSVHELAKLANMDVSLFERLVKNGYPYHTLGLQHRMLTPLTEHIVKPYFYQMLNDAPSVSLYPNVAGMATNLFFWSHGVAEDYMGESTSRKNSTEAEMCVNLANYILIQGQYKASEITIMGMYSAQVSEIKRQLQNAGGDVRDVAVETVDSFQGKENRIMILSLVRSCTGGVGFLAIANRITVALTRAQHGFYCIGNFLYIAEFSELWNNIVDSLNNVNMIDYRIPLKCQRHGNETAVGVNLDFQNLVPRGGCLDTCGYVMNCGHECNNVCHPPYQHERGDIECTERCERRCEMCGAVCTKKCRDPCGTCHAVVTITLDCGHEVRCECGARRLAKCKEPCPVQLECGHPCQNKCSVECIKMEKCEVGIAYTHPICSHTLTLPCKTVFPILLGKEPQPPQCYVQCPERLVCGHKCPLNCGERCPTTCEQTVRFTGECGHSLEKKCSENPKSVKCTWMVPSDMPHCSHTIQTECHASRNQNECKSTCRAPTSCGHTCTLRCGECYRRASVHECDAKCIRELPCGHKCEQLCGRPCVCIQSCRNRCSHQRCGSIHPNASGGKNSFGRSCSDGCVLCLQPCDNHCEHRSCSKKCYEVCDVSPCSAECKKQLRCGHACLGLCGEPCPALCGTCSIAGYKTLLEQYRDETEEGGSSKELTRLIQIPECGHVFPYKFVDGEVKRQMERGTITLKCPRCGKFMDDCRRYTRHQRRLWLEADARKWEKRMVDQDWSRAEVVGKYNGMRNDMRKAMQSLTELSRVCGVKKEGSGVLALDFFRQTEVIYTKLIMEMERGNATGEYWYWNSVLSCFKSLCGLMIGYLSEWDRLRVDFCNEKQPNLRGVMDEAFERKRQRLIKMKETFKDLLSTLESSLGDRRVGALVPHFRGVMIKCVLQFHMERLHGALRGERKEGGAGDLTVEVAGGLKRMIKQILYESPASLPDKHLENLVKNLNTSVYDKLKSFSNLQKTAFNAELPQF